MLEGTQHVCIPLRVPQQQLLILSSAPIKAHLMTLFLIGNSHGIRHHEFPLLKMRASSLEGGAIPTKVRALHDSL